MAILGCEESLYYDLKAGPAGGRLRRPPLGRQHHPPPHTRLVISPRQANGVMPFPRSRRLAPIPVGLGLLFGTDRQTDQCWER
jgi:hypothetical protein